MSCHRSIALISLIAIAALCQCSPKPPEPVAPASEKKSFATLEELSVDTRKLLEEFGAQFEQALKTEEPGKLVEYFDLDASLDSILGENPSSSLTSKNFRQGFTKGLKQGLEFTLKTWKEDPKYKGVRLVDGQPVTRFRFFSANGGVAIIDFRTTESPDGKLKIRDFFNQTIGIGFVEQSRQTALPILAQMDRNIVQRLFGRSHFDKADFDKLSALTQHYVNGRHAEANATFKTLSPTLQQDKVAVFLHLSSLMQLGDSEAYKDGLLKASETFEDGNYQFMLVDVYFLDKDYEKAIQCINTFMDKLEEDALLLGMRSSMELLANRTIEARATLDRALKLEPDCIFAHNIGLQVFLAQKDFDATRKSMIFLEEHGHQFDDLSDPAWAEFLQSPAADRWR